MKINAVKLAEELFAIGYVSVAGITYRCREDSDAVDVSDGRTLRDGEAFLAALREDERLGLL